MCLDTNTTYHCLNQPLDNAILPSSTQLSSKASNRHLVIEEQFAPDEANQILLLHHS